MESNTAEAEGYVDHYGRQKKLTTLIRVDIWTPLYVVNHSSLRNTVDWSILSSFLTPFFLLCLDICLTFLSWQLTWTHYHRISTLPRRHQSVPRAHTYTVLCQRKKMFHEDAKKHISSPHPFFDDFFIPANGLEKMRSFTSANEAFEQSKSLLWVLKPYNRH